MTNTYTEQISAKQLVLDSLDSRTPWNDERIDSLEERKKEEIEFHNFERENEDSEIIAKQTQENVHANKKWYRITNRSRKYVGNWIKLNSSGKIFLDYACGAGGNAIKSSLAGAELSVGLDISDVSIKLAKSRSNEAGVEPNTVFIQGDCEATELPSNSIDTIICCGMLHHLDLEKAFTELRRILKPGGKILCVEALANNPLIQWYRNTTPNMRTEWETHHILRHSTLKYSQKWFNLGEVRYWHLASIPAAVIPIQSVRDVMVSAGDVVDAVALRIPFLQRMAWQFTFELIRP